MIRQQVEAHQAGLRFDQAAAELFPDFSRARLQSWIREGNLTLDGKSAKPGHRVVGGEILGLEAPQDSEPGIEPQNIPLQVIAADEHIIVLDKPAGLVVHPAAGHRDGTLQNGLLYFDPGLAAIPRSGIVHRLDKDTSGVMVVARSLKAHASLVAQLQERSMSRIYEAVAHGTTPREGTVDAPVGRHSRDRQRMAVIAGGRPALTRYRLLQPFAHFSHLRLSLESGRTHQIRVHMRHIGHPLVGDPRYGQKQAGSRSLPAGLGEVIRLFPRQALHARRLVLLHPESRQTREFEAPLPRDLMGLLETLRSLDL